MSRAREAAKALRDAAQPGFVYACDTGAKDDSIHAAIRGALAVLDAVAVAEEADPCAYGEARGLVAQFEGDSLRLLAEELLLRLAAQKTIAAADTGIAFGELCSNGEMRLVLSVGTAQGSAFISREFWIALGERGGWTRDEERAVDKGCTGLAARWCPNHGNCCCPEELTDELCPLHRFGSSHGGSQGV